MEVTVVFLDGLSANSYDFKLVVTDEFGNSANDNVIVYVIAGEAIEKLERKAPGFTGVIAVIVLLSLGVFGRMIRRKE